MYNYQYQLAEKGISCWALKVKSLLFQYGFGFAWQNQSVGHIKVFMSMFKQRCIDIDRQLFNGKVDSFSKLEFYRRIKLCDGFQYYLSCVEVRAYCIALCTVGLCVPAIAHSRYLQSLSYGLYLHSILWMLYYLFLAPE